MNRRNFLKGAAASAFGAAGTILVPSSVAAELLDKGESKLTPDDLIDEKRIITREDLVNEIVDMSQFGDNLVDLLLNADGALTFRREEIDGMEAFRVWGITHPGAKFKQHGKYKLFQAGLRNTVGWRSRQFRYTTEKVSGPEDMVFAHAEEDK